MKDEKHLHKLFGDILQKKMDEEHIEVINEEMATGRKLQASYEQEDMFDAMKEETREKFAHEKHMQKVRDNKLIHAHDPNKKIVMVMPDE